MSVQYTTNVTMIIHHDDIHCVLKTWNDNVERIIQWTRFHGKINYHTLSMAESMLKMCPTPLFIWSNFHPKKNNNKIQERKIIIVKILVGKLIKILQYTLETHPHRIHWCSHLMSTFFKTWNQVKIWYNIKKLRQITRVF